MAGFELAITAKQQPETHALNSAAIGISRLHPWEPRLDLFAIHPVQTNKLFESICSNVCCVQQLDIHIYRTYKVIYIYMYICKLLDLINYPFSIFFDAVYLLRKLFHILIVLKLLTINHW